ncbi:MAG: hypothetical protein JWP72_1117 [Massilia sp.]|nr:hypothetical protein [Massilia sp.]
MSSTRAVRPSRPARGARLWKGAATLGRNFLERLVVPVASTDEMNKVWKLYRLTSSSDRVRPAVAGEPAPRASR